MPLSDAGSTDALLKLLQLELDVAMGMDELRKAGWGRFRNLDHPKTTDPVRLATEAFIYLSIDDQDNWRQNYSVIEGILSFLQSRRQASPTDEQLSDLVTALEFSPVTVNDIRAWFREVFPPLPG